MFAKTRSTHALATMADWSRVEDAVVAANFCMLDEHGGDHGLDGADWIIAGRRRHDYHRIRRWSPDGALYDLVGDVRSSRHERRQAVVEASKPEFRAAMVTFG
jgi:hypothetical protein